jgi:serine/threonine protein kinase
MAKLEAGYHEYQESRLVDFGSIEDDLSMIEAKRTSEVQKISPKTEKNISRSYSLFPDGTLYVHLRSEDSIRVGDETKWGSLEGGGYKTPKFMKNVKNEKLGMRLVVKRAVVNSREWQRQRTNILKFMKDIEGEKHLCQMKYIQWEGKPKKLLFGMSSRLKGKSADPTKTFKEAFLCDYYPLCASKIVKTPDITYESAVDFSLQLALTVQTIHKKGWAHRDIKPDNMYVEDGNVILADFDTVHRADDKDASADSERGTPGYSPKEYGLEQPVEDAKPADIYAMGISLMEMYITKGPPPWIDAEDSPMQKTYALSTSKYPEGLQQLRESAKTPLEHLILDMCDPDPEKRPKIDEVVSKLQALKA